MKRIFLSLVFALLWFAPAARAQMQTNVQTAGLAVTTASASTAIAGSGPVIFLFNDGTSEIFWNVGNSSVTATTASVPLGPGSCFAALISDTKGQYIAAITATGSSTLRVTRGSGTPISCGGGGGGGGSGGSVTQGTTPWTVDTTGSGKLDGELTAAVPCLNATAYNTNTYTIGQTNPVNCDLNSNIYVNARINNTPSVTLAPPNVAGTLVWGHTTSAMTGTSSTQVMAAVAGFRIYVTHVDCNNTSLTVGTLVSIQDGSSGTTMDVLAAGTNFSGQSSTASALGALFATTSGNGLYAADVTTGASVICNASGYSGS